MTPSTTKTLRAGVSLAVYGVVLLMVNFVHVCWLSVDVVFYAALADALVAAALTGLVLVLAGWLAPLGGFERGQLAALWLMCGYVFAISVPTVIDRSLSFYLLEKIHQHDGAIRRDRFEHVIANQYLAEHRVADVRLTEQQSSGTLMVDDECVRLTARGQRLAQFSRFYRSTFLPRRRKVGGDYSDALTAPLRGSAPQAAYRCPADDEA